MIDLSEIDQAWPKLRIANGAVTGIEHLRNAADMGSRLLMRVKDVVFVHHIDSDEISRSCADRERIAKLFGRPLAALQGLFDDGREAGRKDEQESELRLLRQNHERMYAHLRHKALADSWNAVAASLEGKP